MKSSLIALLFITIIKSNLLSQVTLPIDKETNMITYEAVVNVDSMKASEIYSSALSWFAKEFKSAKDVIQLQDKENFKIIGKGLFAMSMPSMLGLPLDGNTKFTITISCKDNKYKYNITDFVWSDSQSKVPLEKIVNKDSNAANKTKTNLKNGVENLIESLKKSIKKSSDW